MRIDRRAFLGGAAATVALQIGLEPSTLAGPRKPFPELSLSGSAGAMGLAHGRAFPTQIKNNVGFYMRWLKRITGVDTRRLLGVARTFTPVLTRYVPQQLEEMKGIARGSGRSLDEILAVNARTDMLVMGRAPKAGNRPGCTALALTRRVGGKQLLALGQNWDWRQDLAKGVIVLRLKPDKGPRLVTFTEAGMVGKIGFNQHRLGVCLNFLSHATETPDRGPGVPVHCLLRAVMGCRTLEEAYKMVAWVPRCASANFLMGQATSKGVEAVDVEWTPSAVARIPLRRQILVHTNHFKDPALAPGCPDQKGKSTLNRNATATRLASTLGKKYADPVARMKKILTCREGAPYSVSKSSAPDSPSRTLAGIVMDLTHNRLHLVAGRPHKGRWINRPGV